MRFASTRGGAPVLGFREAVFAGLAADGGLYHPTGTPDLSALFASFEPEVAFTDLAERVSIALLAEELGADAVRRIARRAFPFGPQLRRVDENRSLLELWHGPSYAFKDFGASFLASAMEEFLADSDEEAVILVATSGDTGSAVARAFHGKRNIRVVILYPSGRVSPLQEMQLTTLGGNVTALEVRGAFDDCQRMVKEAFLDPELSRRMTLTSANSISLGRLLPQAFYYIHAAAALRDGRDLIFCVPSGNFGNLTAGVYAWNWGLPVKRFLAATNVNDVVPEYLRSGLYHPRPSVQTLSNAMDVGSPSNFERLQAIFQGDGDAMARMLHGEVVTDSETLQTIREVERSHGLLIDPHTAVGWKAAERFLAASPDAAGAQIVIVSTAHAAKFLETIREATGREPALPEGLAVALRGTKQSLLIDNSLAALRSELLKLSTT